MDAALRDAGLRQVIQVEAKALARARVRRLPAGSWEQIYDASRTIRFMRDVKREAAPRVPKPKAQRRAGALHVRLPSVRLEAVRRSFARTLRVGTNDELVARLTTDPAEVGAEQVSRVDSDRYRGRFKD